MELTTPRLRLRPFRLADFEAVQAYENAAGMHLYEPPPPSAEAIRLYLAQEELWAQEATAAELTARNHANPEAAAPIVPNANAWAVTIAPDDTARGQVKLRRLNSEIREWEIGWQIHPADWGHGYATEAARAVLAYAFNVCQAHRVAAFCHVDNLASVRVMQKLGMQQEGKLRATSWLHNAWHDEWVYAILDSDWLYTTTKTLDGRPK
jgi:RimJ/RimL family protein N-acetyltransferase